MTKNTVLNKENTFHSITKKKKKKKEHQNETPIHTHTLTVYIYKHLPGSLITPQEIIQTHSSSTQK